MPSAIGWGDKTPVNTLHLRWIDRVFPDARYIHMIRDGRDAISSYVKAGIYSNVDEAAHRWSNSVTMGCEFGKDNPERYLEVRYENLVQNPDKEIQRVCRFLGLTFSPNMLRFQDEVDDLGDTHLDHHRGLQREINTDSIGNWKTRLSTDESKRVETLIDEELLKLGYI